MSSTSNNCWKILGIVLIAIILIVLANSFTQSRRNSHSQKKRNMKMQQESPGMLNANSLPLGTLSQQTQRGEITKEKWNRANPYFAYPGSYVPPQVYPKTCPPHIAGYTPSASPASPGTTDQISQQQDSSSSSPSSLPSENSSNGSKMSQADVFVPENKVQEFDELLMTGPQDATCFLENDAVDFTILDTKKNTTHHLWGQPAVTLEGGDEGPFNGIDLSTIGPYARPRPVRTCGF